jgi:hypothetical protein
MALGRIGIPRQCRADWPGSAAYSECPIDDRDAVAVYEPTIPNSADLVGRVPSIGVARLAKPPGRAPPIAP